jgi:Cu/Ag efflux pump CusA
VLRWLLGVSLQYRSVVLAGAAILFLLGLYRLRDAPVNVLPELSPTLVEIQTEAPGLSAGEVEDLITVNTEELLAGTPWVKTIRSKSVPGMSSVLLLFEDGTDMMRARQVVQERLIGAYALPNVSKRPVMLQPLSTASRAMIIGLSSKEKSLIDLSVLTRWTIVPKLLGVPGVANVAVWGQRARQLQVQVDSAHLRDAGVTLNQIVKTAGEALWVSPLSFLEASMPGAGGWIDTPNQRLGIQHRQPITSAAQLAQVAVDGASLRLGDVAKVVEEHPPLIGDAIVKNGPGLLLVVEKFPEAEASEVIGGVEAAMRELEQGMPGIDVDTSIYRETSFALRSARNLTIAGLGGALLLVLALFALLFEWRVAVVSIAAISLSLVTAGLLLHLRHAPIDIMAVTGLVIALVVIIDDAVNDAENVVRKLRRRGDRSRPAAIFESCLEMRGVLLYATLAIVLLVVPLFLIRGPVGAFLRPLAVSYVLAVLASTAVALTVTPALAMLLLRDVPAEAREPALLRWLRPRYERVLLQSAGTPRRTCLVAAAVALACILTVPMLKWSLSPSFKEENVQISWRGGAGTSHPEMQRMMMQASQELQQIPGVRRVSAHIGRAETGDQVVGIEAGQVWVGLDGSNYDATLAAIREKVQGYPGLEAEVRSYLTAKVEETLSQPDDSVVVRIQGPERAVLRREAERVRQMLSIIPGMVNLRVAGETQAPEVEIEVNLVAAGRVGLKPGDVRRAAATVFAGLEVGQLFQQQKVFDVVVRGTPEIRQSIADIRELLIDTPSGGHVRLADIADVRVVPTTAVIHREGISRYLDVQADVAGRDRGAVVADVEERLRKAAFPLEYHPVVLRDYTERQAAHWRITVAALVIATGIYFLLQACFQSWLLASLFCLPLLAALAGGALSMLVAGGAVFLGSLAGLLGVIGVTVRQGVLLIDRIKHLEEDRGSAPPGPDLVLRAAQERFAPVVASALAIVAAMLPAVALGSAAGLEIMHPAAVVILGGTVASAAAILLLVPALYLSFATTQPGVQTYGGEQHAS